MASPSEHATLGRRRAPRRRRRDLDVGQLGRKPLLESPLVVLDVREDPLPVVQAHQTASEQVVGDPAAENRASEEDTPRARYGRRFDATVAVFHSSPPGRQWKR